jgi:Flp pilus assembly pilin Flp
MMGPDVADLSPGGELMGRRRRAASVLRRWQRATRRRSRSERGASLVEYAFLVGLIAIVAFAGVTFLGHSVSNLFTHEANCLGTPGDSNIQSGQSILQQAQSLGRGTRSTDGVELTSLDSQANGGQSGNGQLGTGLKINDGNPPDAPACGAADNGSQNQQQVLQLLQ